MGQLSNYTEKKVLDHILKTTSYSPPGTIYLGLSTTAPSPVTAGSPNWNWTDPTYTGYARVSIPFGAAASKQIAQNALVSFAACTGGTSTVGYWGLWDQLTGGNLLAYGALSAPQTIITGNTPSIASGQVYVDMSAGATFQQMANTILNWLFAAGTLAQPTHVKIALSTTTPADGADNGSSQNITEPSGNNYSQETCDVWDAASGNPEATANTSNIVMPTPSGSWGLITYGVLYLDTTPCFYGTVPNQTPTSGDTVEWLAGQFTISLQ